MPAGAVYGRQVEIDRIAALAADVVESSHGAAAVLVTGEAGIGKTALLDRIAADWVADGFQVVRTGLSEPERRLVWAGLHVATRSFALDVFDSLPDAVRDAIPIATGRIPGSTDETSVAFALGALLDQVADTSPTLLVIDDLHWLDASSAAAFGFAVRSAARAPVLTLAAARPNEPMPIDPLRLLDPDRVHEITLAGLSPASIHHVVEDRCGVALRRPDLIRLHEATGGSPLHAIEAGRAVADGLAPSEAVRRTSLPDAIAARLEVLDEEQRRVLRVIALCGTPTIALVAAAEPDVDVDAVIAGLETGGLVAADRDEIRFTHPLVRTGVEQLMGGIERRRLERRLADVVTDPEERADLLADAAVEADADVASALGDAAARAAEVGAMHVAADRYERAARLTPSDDPISIGRRLLDAAEAAMHAGDRWRPLDLADEAATFVDSWEDRLRATVVRVLTVGNRPDRNAATALVREALGQFDEPLALARLQGLLAQGLSGVDLRAGLEAATSAVVWAEMAGDPLRLAIERARLVQQRFLVGEPIDLDRVAIDAADPTQPILDRMDLMSTLTWADRVDDAVRLLSAVLHEAQRVGSMDEVQLARAILGDAHVRAGRYDEAESHLLAWLELEPMIGGMNRGTNLGDLAVVYALTGRHGAARALLDEAFALGDDMLTNLVCLRANAALVAVSSGDWAAAVEHGREARRLADTTGYGNLTVAPFRAELVEGLVHLGAVDEAAEVADEHQRLADRQQLRRGFVEARRARALVHGALGELDVAADLLDEAVALHEGWPVPLERGRTLLASGALLRRMGRRGAASGRLDEARATFATIGAVPWVERVDRERERLGGRRDAGTELTPTEHQIARLVAAGHSNAAVAAEIHVSLRTVESNLTRVYRKLGVRSRAELAARFRAAG